MTKYWWPSIGVIRLLLPEAEALLAEIDALQDELTDRKKQVEAAFEILEKYTPAEKLQEANDEMTLKVAGFSEQAGRDLLRVLDKRISKKKEKDYRKNHKR